MFLGDFMKLDVIIPCFNAKYTLFKTLSSIALQRNIEKIRVYLVNDCSDYDYKDFIDYFSNYFHIEEIKSDINVGPGEARNIGIRNSSNPYIVFIDSDDVFYSPYSLDILYKEITKTKANLVISDFIYERDNERLIKKNSYVWLHGKIYNRKYLEENNIYFNNTRANEDNGFNNLIILTTNNVKYLNKITYVYKENENSITRKNNREYKISGLEGYAYNIRWALDEAIKRNANPYKIKTICFSNLHAMYYYYLEYFKDYDVDCLLRWSKKLVEIYDKYNHIILEEFIFDIIRNQKIKEYEERNIQIDKFITFDEFLKKVRDINDRYYYSSI